MLKGIALSGKHWGLSISLSFYGKTGNALRSFIPAARIFDGIAPDKVLNLMGGIRIDGAKTSVRRVLTQREQWREILSAMTADAILAT